MKCLKCGKNLPQDHICVQCGELLFASYARFGAYDPCDPKTCPEVHIALTNEALIVTPKAVDLGAAGGLVGGLISGLIQEVKDKKEKHLRRDLLSGIIGVELRKSQTKKSVFFIPHDKIVIQLPDNKLYCLLMPPENASLLSGFLRTAIQRHKSAPLPEMAVSVTSARSRNDNEVVKEHSEGYERSSIAKPTNHVVLQCPKCKLLFPENKSHCTVCGMILTKKLGN